MHILIIEDSKKKLRGSNIWVEGLQNGWQIWSIIIIKIFRYEVSILFTYKIVQKYKVRNYQI